MSKLIQYVIVSKQPGLSLAKVIGNCCQAVVAVGQNFRDDHANRAYVKDILENESVVVQVRLNEIETSVACCVDC